MKLERRIRMTGKLQFDTAFHVGSGREGELGTDSGVLRDPAGLPMLPGSSIKGKYRATVEKIAPTIGLTACLLDSALSSTMCVSDADYLKKTRSQFRLLPNQQKKLEWLAGNTCDVCKLFGSQLQASRIFFSDGRLDSWVGALQVRDGVCIDRDSETARKELKYDFEVVPAGATFHITMEMENPSAHDTALFAAGLSEWQCGVRLGGFTSRGLGLARLEIGAIEQVDFSDSKQRNAYLLGRTWQEMNTEDLMVPLRALMGA